MKIWDKCVRFEAGEICGSFMEWNRNRSKKMNINNKWELLSIITLFGFFIRNII